jgi:putative salt-induced outer membrane protein YdiY
MLKTKKQNDTVPLILQTAYIQHGSFNMNMSWKKIVLVSAILLAALGTAEADEVHLMNGDRITGEVVTMEDDKLVFRTSYAGEITIKWRQIDSIVTDTPVEVSFQDETTVIGTTKPAKDGGMRLESTETTDVISFRLDDVKAINPKLPEERVEIKADVNFGLKYERGNTDKDVLHLDGSFSARGGDNRYSAKADVNREESSGVETENNWLALAKYDRFFSEKNYCFAATSFEHDEFKGLNLRTTLATGTGRQFIETALTNLLTELGLAYVIEDFTTKDNDYTALRWSLDFDRYVVSDKIQFFHWDELFWSFEDTRNVILRTKTGFRFPLYGNFKWTVRYDFDLDTDPDPGRKEDDQRLIVTVGYEY